VDSQAESVFILGAVLREFTEVSNFEASGQHSNKTSTKAKVKKVKVEGIWVECPTVDGGEASNGIVGECEEDMIWWVLGWEDGWFPLIVRYHHFCGGYETKKRAM
jgi:hypothetical protein